MKSWAKDKVKKDFEELMLEVRRVTRVTTGWRKLSFRATVVVGNKRWKVGLGVAKGPDVTAAVQKASREAYKNMFVVPITWHNTVPYETTTKYKSCIVKLLPAQAGTWLKAWSSVRAVLELAWFENILSKIMWSSNKLNNALATLKALSNYKYADHFNQRRVKKDKDTQEHDEEVVEQESNTESSWWVVDIAPEVVIEKESSPKKKSSSKKQAS